MRSLRRLRWFYAMRMRSNRGNHVGLSAERWPLVHHLHAGPPCATDEELLAGTRRSMDERAAAVFVDMDAYDFVERALGLEAEVTGAARIDALRPARHDARDQRVLGAANAPGNAVAGDSAQRRDLLCDSAAHARHREIDARTERVARQARRVNEETDCGARACMRVHHRFRNRQHGFKPG